MPTLCDRLPHWEDRNSTDVFDDVYANEISNSVGILYSLKKIKENDYLGYLALFKGINAPKLIANIHKYNVHRQNIFFAPTGNHLIVQVCVLDPKSGENVFPYVVIDVEREAFSFFMCKVRRYCYRVLHPGGDILIISDDGICIHTDSMTLFPLERINELPSLI